MAIQNKRFEEIAEPDLRDLLDNQEPEGKTIDYKQQLPGRTDADKKEFMADVSSFSNTSGGFLIYGMEEDNGLPTALVGLPGINADEEIRRLDSMISTGIEPHIPGFSVRAIRLSSGNEAIVVAVPRSWALPHRVRFQDWGRFYSRNSRGKYLLDIGEIRAAFTLSESFTTRVRAFRAERLGLILADEGPVLLPPGVRDIWHLVPFGAFDSSPNFDLVRLLEDRLGDLKPPSMAGGFDHRFNFDGLLSWVPGGERGPNTIGAYLQVFRTGSIEAVQGATHSTDSMPVRMGTAFEDRAIEKSMTYLGIQQRLGVEPPIVLMLSLAGVKGYRIAPPFHPLNSPGDAYPIDRDILLLPELVLAQFPSNRAALASLLRPTFDALWNASGWPRSPNYDSAGQPKS